MYETIDAGAPYAGPFAVAFSAAASFQRDHQILRFSLCGRARIGTDAFQPKR